MCIQGRKIGCCLIGAGAALILSLILPKWGSRLLLGLILLILGCLLSNRK